MTLQAGKAGFVGLIHYVVDSLIGGVVPTADTLMTTTVEVEETADLSRVSTTIDPNAKISTLDLKIEDEVEAAVETDPDDAVKATAAIDSEPAAQPAVLPAPAPETTPPAEPIVDDGVVEVPEVPEVVEVPEEEGEEEVVEVDNPGNKFTPPPILAVRQQQR